MCNNWGVRNRAGAASLCLCSTVCVSTTRSVVGVGIETVRSYQRGNATRPRVSLIRRDTILCICNNSGCMHVICGALAYSRGSALLGAKAHQLVLSWSKGTRLWSVGCVARVDQLLSTQLSCYSNQRTELKILYTTTTCRTSLGHQHWVYTSLGHSAPLPHTSYQD